MVNCTNYMKLKWQRTALQNICNIRHKAKQIDLGHQMVCAGSWDWSWIDLTSQIDSTYRYHIRGILIQVFIFFHLGHTSKLFLFVHWFQNCFRFRSRTLRSGGGKFFSTLFDLEGEKREKNAKFYNWLKTHPKVLNA